MDPQVWNLKLTILYGTLTVAKAQMPNPFNDWRPEHELQGFSWRPGSVSFGTSDSDVPAARVIVELAGDYAASPSAVRIIRVPFSVDRSGLEVTSPTNGAFELPVSSGHYALYFSIEPTEDDQGGAPWQYRLTLVPDEETVEAVIIRADGELRPPERLLMEAEPA